jgi:DNA-binding Xre family transcriptional regulator
VSLCGLSCDFVVVTLSQLLCTVFRLMTIGKSDPRVYVVHSVLRLLQGTRQRTVRFQIIENICLSLIPAFFIVSTVSLAPC